MSSSENNMDKLENSEEDLKQQILGNLESIMSHMRKDAQSSTFQEIEELKTRNRMNEETIEELRSKHEEEMEQLRSQNTMHMEVIRELGIKHKDIVNHIRGVREFCADTSHELLNSLDTQIKNFEEEQWEMTTKRCRPASVAMDNEEPEQGDPMELDGDESHPGTTPAHSRSVIRNTPAQSSDDEEEEDDAGNVDDDDDDDIIFDDEAGNVDEKNIINGQRSRSSPILLKNQQILDDSSNERAQHRGADDLGNVSVEMDVDQAMFMVDALRKLKTGRLDTFVVTPWASHELERIFEILRNNCGNHGKHKNFNCYLIGVVSATKDKAILAPYFERKKPKTVNGTSICFFCGDPHTCIYLIRNLPGYKIGMPCGSYCTRMLKAAGKVFEHLATGIVDDDTLPANIVKDGPMHMKCKAFYNEFMARMDKVGKAQGIKAGNVPTRRPRILRKRRRVQIE